MTDEDLSAAALADPAPPESARMPAFPRAAEAEQQGEACGAITELLARVGDTWSMQTIRALGDGPVRFNALRREIGEISQKMMTVTLRRLERDGFVSRTVFPSNPPQVEYALTDLGCELLGPVSTLAQWTIANRPRIEAARRAFDQRKGR